MSAAPKVSVVIPVFNEVATLADLHLRLEADILRDRYQLRRDALQEVYRL